MQETWVQYLGWEDPLEEGMATYSSILAWRIPMDRGAWRAAVHGVTKSQTRLSIAEQAIILQLKINQFKTKKKRSQDGGCLQGEGLVIGRDKEWGATGMLVVFYLFSDGFNDVFLRKFIEYTLMICILLCKYVILHQEIYLKVLRLWNSNKY